MKRLLAHGSSDSAHLLHVEQLATRVSSLLDEEVGVSFLADNLVPQESELLPLFLGEGVHVRRDASQLATASGCTLLSPLGSHVEAITALLSKRFAGNTIFLLYQPDGFEQLREALEPIGKIAYLHGEPSLAATLAGRETGAVITVQPLLLFPGRSLARIRKMIEATSNTDLQIGPVLSELDGFSELVADCFRRIP